ncbi:MAG: glycoside hydrolase [Actinomycetota bacterium]|nr:glycoside hydrolase [Actinomycetota bacterium]
MYWTRTFPPVPFGDPSAPVSPVYYLRSTDHGATWSERVEIDPGNQETERPPLIAADPNSEALYVVWHSHADPNNTTPDFEGDFDIFLRFSLDGGDN